jgi:hypothetical protein
MESNFDYDMVLRHVRNGVEFKEGDTVICRGEYIGTILGIDDNYQRREDRYQKFKTYIIGNLRDREGKKPLYENGEEYEASIFYQKNIMFKDDYNYFVAHYNMYESTLFKFEKEKIFLPFMMERMGLNLNENIGSTVYTDKQAVMEIWKD